MASVFSEAWALEQINKFRRGPRLDETWGIQDVSDEGPESDLQSKCEKWLKDHGYHFLHDRSRKVNPKGMFLDLHIYLPAGRHVVIELKVKDNKMSPEQKDTYQILLFNKHEIYEIRSYKAFLEVMNNNQDDGREGKNEVQIKAKRD